MKPNVQLSHLPFPFGNGRGLPVYFLARSPSFGSKSVSRFTPIPLYRSARRSSISATGSTRPWSRLLASRAKLRTPNSRSTIIINKKPRKACSVGFCGDNEYHQEGENVNRSRRFSAGKEGLLHPGL